MENNNTNNILILVVALVHLDSEYLTNCVHIAIMTSTMITELSVTITITCNCM